MWRIPLAVPHMLAILLIARKRSCQYCRQYRHNRCPCLDMDLSACESIIVPMEIFAELEYRCDNGYTNAALSVRASAVILFLCYLLIVKAKDTGKGYRERITGRKLQVVFFMMAGSHTMDKLVGLGEMWKELHSFNHRLGGGTPSTWFQGRNDRQNTNVHSLYCK